MPILVPKPKWSAKTPSLWVEDSNGKDNNHYHFVFKEQLGKALHKPKVLQIPETPSIVCQFSTADDAAELKRNLVFNDNTPSPLRERITSFVQEFWDVFYENGVKSPVHCYKLVIDTGDHLPIAV